MSFSLVILFVQEITLISTATNRSPSVVRQIVPVLLDQMLTFFSHTVCVDLRWNRYKYLPADIPHSSESIASVQEHNLLDIYELSLPMLASSSSGLCGGKCLCFEAARSFRRNVMIIIFICPLSSYPGSTFLPGEAAGVCNCLLQTCSTCWQVQKLTSKRPRRREMYTGNKAIMHDSVQIAPAMRGGGVQIFVSTDQQSRCRSPELLFLWRCTA